MKNAILTVVKLLTFSAIVAGLSMPSHAAPKSFKKVTPQDVLEIAKGYGSAAFDEPEEPEDGGEPENTNPVIQGRMDGFVYFIFFYDCDKRKACRDMVLSAGFETDDVDLDLINKWNKGSKFGQAYLDDDGDANLDMAVNLYGGIYYTNLDDTFDWWRASLSGFVDHIKFDE